MRNRAIAFAGRLNRSFAIFRQLGRRLSTPAAATLAAILAAGCASPGPPKPPTLNLPALVTDIHARRMGSQVLLHWTTPSNTSDGLPFKGKMTATVCREVGPRPATPAARLTACAPVLHLDVTPGPSEAIDDLPANLQVDPVTLLTYRVELFNAAGRSAGKSDVAAFAAAGTPPPAIEDLHATNLEAGAVLEWQPSSVPSIVDLERTDLTPPAPHKASPKPAPAASSQPAANNKKKKKKSQGKSKPAKTTTSHPAKSQPDQTARIHLRITEPTNGHQPAADVADGAQRTQGTVDLTAQMGSTYRYVAHRVRSVTLGVHKLEIDSAPSQPVLFAHLDIFPPQRPTGLEAIPSSDPQHPAAIDLSWEPNPEVDLAGYLLFRQALDASGAPTGASLQLTPTPVPTPAFTDLTAVPGQNYAYQVVAVDQAGNRSPLSDHVQQIAAH